MFTDQVHLQSFLNLSDDVKDTQNMRLCGVCFNFFCYLYLRVSSFQETDGQLDTLLEDLVVLSAHHQICEQLRCSFSVQATLNRCHCHPVPLLLCTWRTHTNTSSTNYSSVYRPEIWTPSLVFRSKENTFFLLLSAIYSGRLFSWRETSFTKCNNIELKLWKGLWWL